MSTANEIERTPICPACGSFKLAKNGKTPAGLQKFRCLDGRNIGCHRQFVAGSDHAVNPVIRSIVVKLLAGKVKPGTIHKAVPGISPRWIYELKRRIR
jgi:transposase-like protein